MGIRFYCPNGHKLNVKTFQAGMRGICPYCGARIQIPLASTRRSRKDRGGGQPAGSGQDAGWPTTAITLAYDTSPGAPSDPLAAPGGAAQASQPVTPLDPSAVAPGWTGAVPGQPLGSASPLAGQPAAPVAPAVSQPVQPLTPLAAQPVQPIGPAAPAGAGGALPMTATAAPVPSTADLAAAARASPAMAERPVAAIPDPLTEAPNVVWYVRPASGGQFGPATCDIMRTWIAEGRVGADALVWREGWRDWQQAAATFPQLAPAEPVLGLGAQGSGRRGTGGSAATSGSGYRGVGRRRSNTANAVIITFLVVAVLVLALVFLYVLLESPPATRSDTRPRPVAVVPWDDPPGLFGAAPGHRAM